MPSPSVPGRNERVPFQEHVERPPKKKPSPWIYLGLALVVAVVCVYLTR